MVKALHATVDICQVGAGLSTEIGCCVGIKQDAQDMKSCINPSKTSESNGIFSRQEVLGLSLWLLSSSHCDKGLSCVHGQV